MSEYDVIVGVTGASGVIYARDFTRQLLLQGLTVHLIPTDHAERVWHEELDERGNSSVIERDAMLADWSDRLCLSAEQMKRLIIYGDRNVGAAPASGTFQARAMVVIPCSMNTLAKIAHGIADSLLTRSAAVSLKQKRPLVLVPRETPLSLADLRNQVAAAEAGAVILPAAPAFYHKPAGVEDLVRYMVCKICDQLGLPCSHPVRYGAPAPAPAPPPPQS